MSHEPIPGESRRYSMAAVLEITGVERQMMIRYCEAGLLPAAPDQLESAQFDDETVCRLRHAEYLRRRHGVNLAGIRMITELLREVEQLREELRFRTRH